MFLVAEVFLLSLLAFFGTGEGTTTQYQAAFLWYERLPSTADPRGFSRYGDKGVYGAPLAVPNLLKDKSAQVKVASVLVASHAYSLTCYDTKLLASEREAGEAKPEVRWTMNTKKTIGSFRGDPLLIGDLADPHTKYAVVTTNEGWAAKINLEKGFTVWKWQHPSGAKMFSPILIDELDGSLISRDLEIGGPILAFGSQAGVNSFIDSSNGRLILSTHTTAGVWKEIAVTNKGGKMFWATTAVGYVDRIDITPRRDDSYGGGGDGKTNVATPGEWPLKASFSDHYSTVTDKDAGKSYTWLRKDQGDATSEADQEFEKKQNRDYSYLNLTSRWRYDVSPNLAEGDWRARGRSWIWTKPAVATMNQQATDLVITGCVDGKMRGLSLATGKEKWSYNAKVAVTNTGIYLFEDRTFVYHTEANGEVCFLKISSKGIQKGLECVPVQSHCKQRGGDKSKLIGDLKVQSIIDDGEGPTSYHVAAVGSCDGKPEVYMLHVFAPSATSPLSSSKDGFSPEVQGALSSPEEIHPPLRAKYTSASGGIDGPAKSCIPYQNFGWDQGKRVLYIGCKDGSVAAVRLQPVDRGGEKKSTARTTESYSEEPSTVLQKQTAKPSQSTVQTDTDLASPPIPPVRQDGDMREPVPRNLGTPKIEELPEPTSSSADSDSAYYTTWILVVMIVVLAACWVKKSGTK